MSDSQLAGVRITGALIVVLLLLICDLAINPTRGFLSKLMQEYEAFDDDLVNLPMEVVLSHGVAFYRDKLEHPEFFVG